MKVAITGANGFIGKTLSLRLRELQSFEIVPLGRNNSLAAASAADAIIHLAGVNRPADDSEFAVGNADVTKQLCDALIDAGKAIPIIYASSIKVQSDTAYGRSKLAAERLLTAYAERVGTSVQVCRLPNVFGKWCRANYNSAVATFCHNAARGVPIDIHDPAAPLQLAYIDDVADRFIDLLRAPAVPGFRYMEVAPIYHTTVGEVADLILKIARARGAEPLPNMGVGLTRALYATYVSYLPAEAIGYVLQRHTDKRGDFAEVLRTEGAGQFSVFTANPGVTRGGHYHHTKVEKFLVLSGHARFGFRHILTGEVCEIDVSAQDLKIVETIPGWAHSIKNVGSDVLICWLWANELFDAKRPDTYPVQGMT